MTPDAVTPGTPLTARVVVEYVPERSEAWRALWDELFAAIAADFARDPDQGATPAGAEERA